ncbi:MAG: hypothetical protein IKS48_01465 [Eubacterium sp.]|nr:hypothetical protein [Eubacterium sp.]
MIWVSRRQLCFIGVVVGLGLVVIGFIIIHDGMKAPLNFNEIDETQMQEGCVVEGSIPYNWGKFASRGNNCDYFIIPFSSESYYGLRVTDPEFHSKLMQQGRDTFGLYENKTKAPKRVYIKGKIKAMSPKVYGFMTSYLSQGGLSEEEIQRIARPYYIQEFDVKTGYAYVLFGAPLMFFTLGLLIIEHKEKVANKNA